MLRVLIVEDNRIFREAFKNDFCERFPSVAVGEAGNGDEAFQKISTSSPHLIFMDIRLPGDNGLQLTKKIKKNFPSIHIAVLTSYDLPEYREAAIESGADRFLVKSSLKWDEVEALVRSITSTVP